MRIPEVFVPPPTPNLNRRGILVSQMLCPQLNRVYATVSKFKTVYTNVPLE